MDTLRPALPGLIILFVVVFFIIRSRHRGPAMSRQQARRRLIGLWAVLLVFFAVFVVLFAGVGTGCASGTLDPLRRQRIAP